MENNIQLLTIEDASRFLNVKISRLRTAIFKKEIGYIKLRGLIRFTKDHLSDWIYSNEIKAR